MGGFFYLLRRAVTFGCIVEVLRAQQWGPLGPAKSVENTFRTICLNPFGKFCGNLFEFFAEIRLNNFAEICSQFFADILLKNV